MGGSNNAVHMTHCERILPHCASSLAVEASPNSSFFFPVFVLKATVAALFTSPALLI